MTTSSSKEALVSGSGWKVLIVWTLGAIAVVAAWTETVGSAAVAVPAGARAGQAVAANASMLIAQRSEPVQRQLPAVFQGIRSVDEAVAPPIPPSETWPAQ